MPEPGDPAEHHDVVVVGGGQAGLSLSWHLTRRGVDHVVLESGTVGHEWRDGRWDNFTLVTPNWQCRLPGRPYSGPDPDGFMRRDEVHAFVRDYAASFRAPVREQATVVRLAQADGGFTVDLRGPAGPATMSADAVVVATGGYHIPVVPGFAERLPRNIRQIHSSQYRSGSDLPPGAVLVVGTGQSGAQIAEDLHLQGRTVHLAVGSAPRCARFYRGRDCVAWLEDMGTYDVAATEVPGGAAAQEKTNHYLTGRDGGRDIDLRAFALDGMQLHGRLTGVAEAADADGTNLEFAATLQFEATLKHDLDQADAIAEGIKDSIDAHIEKLGIAAPTEERYVPVWQPAGGETTLDMAAAGITSIVWCIGFRADHRWIECAVFDGRGRPRQTRGVTGVDGLFFLGLPWMHTWGSGRFAGIARDAEYLADRIGADRVPSARREQESPALPALA